MSAVRISEKKHCRPSPVVELSRTVAVHCGPAERHRKFFCHNTIEIELSNCSAAGLFCTQSLAACSLLINTTWLGWASGLGLNFWLVGDGFPFHPTPHPSTPFRICTKKPTPTTHPSTPAPRAAGLNRAVWLSGWLAGWLAGWVAGRCKIENSK